MISSARNRRLQDIRRLRRCKGDRALLEGTHLLSEAVASGLILEEVLATPEYLASADGRRLAPMLPAPTVVSGSVLESLADTDSPRGIVAIATLPRLGAGALPRRPGGVYLYLDALQDPGNLGALARVAEATGAVGMALANGTVHPNHPRALRGSAGSLLRLPVAVAVAPEDLDHRLRGLHPVWLGLSPHGGERLWEARLDGTLVLAIGSEGQGLSSAVTGRALRALTIPLEPPVESLNATVSAAVALFELRRRRLLKDPG